MPDSTVRTKIHESLNIHRRFSAEIAFNGKFRYDVSEFRNLWFTQVLNLHFRIDFRNLARKPCAAMSNTEDMRQGDCHLFTGRNIDPCYTSHNCVLNLVAVCGADLDKSHALRVYAE